MTLIIENADKNLERAIKNVVKLTDAKMTIQKEPSDRLLSAIKEVEEMEKHPERYKSYNSVEEMFEDLNKWLNIKLNFQRLWELGDRMNITLNIPEETQEVYFEIAKERNITKEELMEEAILEYLDDYKTALKLREERLNGEKGESWQSVKKELGL